MLAIVTKQDINQGNGSHSINHHLYGLHIVTKTSREGHPPKDFSHSSMLNHNHRTTHLLFPPICKTLSSPVPYAISIYISLEFLYKHFMDFTLQYEISFLGLSTQGNSLMLDLYPLIISQNAKFLINLNIPLTK